MVVIAGTDKGAKGKILSIDSKNDVSYTHLDVYKRKKLRGIQRNEIERGQVLAKPGTVTPHHKIKGCLLYTSRCV